MFVRFGKLNLFHLLKEKHHVINDESKFQEKIVHRVQSFAANLSNKSDLPLNYILLYFVARYDHNRLYQNSSQYVDMDK